MAPCCAFRKSDCAPCKNTARNGHNTCASHKHFYDKDNWTDLFFSLDSPFLPTGLDYPQTTLMGRIQTAVEFALANNLVVLTQEDCARIPSPSPDRFFETWRNDAVCLWTLLVRSGKVSPLWNVPLTKFTLFVFTLMRQPAVLDIAPPLEKLLGAFLRHPSLFPPTLLSSVLAFHTVLSRRRRYPEEVRELSYRHILQEFLTHESFTDCLLLSDTVLVNKLTSLPETVLSLEAKQQLSEKIITAVSPLRRAKKTLHHNHVETFKEELVAKAFHPDRVEKWLQEGDFELLDMMFGE